MRSDFRHYVLTRSTYDPALVPLEQNRRRLHLLQGITAPSLAQQVVPFTWVALLQVFDPLLAERLSAFESAGVPFVPIFTTKRYETRAEAAAKAYRHVGWDQVTAGSGAKLTTRLDDDDALAPRMLKRVQRAAVEERSRVALVVPGGIRVWDGRYMRVRHEANAMQTLLSPSGDGRHVYGYKHTRVSEHTALRLLEGPRGWLWVRHFDTLTERHRVASLPIDAWVRSKFPIDWSLLE